MPSYAKLRRAREHMFQQRPNEAADESVARQRRNHGPNQLAARPMPGQMVGQVEAEASGGPRGQAAVSQSIDRRGIHQSHRDLPPEDEYRVDDDERSDQSEALVLLHDFFPSYRHLPTEYLLTNEELPRVRFAPEQEHGPVTYPGEPLIHHRFRTWQHDQNGPTISRIHPLIHSPTPSSVRRIRQSFRPPTPYEGLNEDEQRQTSTAQRQRRVRGLPSSVRMRREGHEDDSDSDISSTGGCCCH